MRFGVVVFPGTWSDCDFHYVISEVLHQPVKYVWHRERNLADVDCVVLPGGFSYGDYLRAGAVAGKSPVVDGLGEFVARCWARAMAFRSSARAGCCRAC
jgi:phosphoribosylformylglycinamidine synthase subunit PurQ / glutaminase